MFQKFPSVLRAILAAGLAAAGCSTTSHRPFLGSSPDEVFLGEVARASLGEAELSRAALERASDLRVKEFARGLIGEQARLDQDLKALASRLGVNLPARLDDDQARLVDRIASRKGAQFDQAYMACLVSDLQGTVTAFEEKARLAAHPDVRSFAEAHLPKLKEQLRRAREVQAFLTPPPPPALPPPSSPGAVNNSGKVIG